ncbi:MAG: amidohydrolase family protein [Acidobacteria bacterium]|nr:amidohydrolase family protein [Acidobacteriota bacterium]
MPFLKGKKRFVALFFVVGCAVTASAWAQTAESTLVLEGATLISPERGAPLVDSLVIVRGNRIESVGALGSVQYPADAQVLRLGGKYLIPGLIDSHIHYRDWLHDLFLVNGTTTVIDMGNTLEWTVAVKEGIAKGKIRGPRMFVTGDRLDGTWADHYQVEHGFLDRWASGSIGRELEPTRMVREYTIDEHRYFVRTPAQGRERVRRMVNGGADAIKVHHKLEPEVLKAITDEAHKLGRPVVGHGLDAREMVDLGMDFIEHMAPVAIATITDREKLKQLQEGKILGSFHLMDPAAFPDVIRKMVNKNVYLNPTLSGTGRGVNHRRKEYEREYREYFSQPGLRYIPPVYVQNFLDEFAFYDRITPEQARMLEEGYKKIETFVRAFSQAGGKLLAGSDPVTTGIPGLGIHQEMELMVDAGVSPTEALKSATLYAAELIHKEKELGTVEAGKLADLVVLGGNPLERIDNTQKVERVILDGKIVDLSFHPEYKIPIPRAEKYESAYPAVRSRIDTMSPAAAAEGTGDLEIVLTGKFLPSSKVLFRETEVASRFENVRTVRVTIPSRLLESAGTYPIQMINPIFGGEMIKSNIVYFVVKFR